MHTHTCARPVHEYKADSTAEQCVTDFLFTFKRSDRATVQTDRVSLRFLAFQEILFAKMQRNGMVPFCVDGVGGWGKWHRCKSVLLHFNEFKLNIFF